MRKTKIESGSRCAVLLVASTILGACSTEVDAPQGMKLASGEMSAKVWGTEGAGVFVRSTPGRSGEAIASLFDGQAVTIGCQLTGESVAGSSVWDYLPSYGGYVSDAFVWTGHDGFAPGVTRCAASSDSDGDEAKPPSGPSGETDDAMVSTAIQEARSQLGYQETGGNCNKFSSYFGRPCEEWCSDFVNYAWQRAGFAVDGITGYSGTIADYGARHGTIKYGMNAAGVKPGDAVLWGTGSSPVGVQSKHVGMVTEVRGDGTIRVIHGNFAMCAADCVYEGVSARSSDVGTDANIYAFVSPAKK
jgi:hypothetical protein